MSLAEVRDALGAYAAAGTATARLEAAAGLAQAAAALAGQLTAIVSPAPGGADLADRAGPDAVCICGDAITWFDGTWHHLYNANLRGTHRHHAQPANPVRTGPGADQEPVWPVSFLLRHVILALDEDPACPPATWDELARLASEYCGRTVPRGTLPGEYDRLRHLTLWEAVGILAAERDPALSEPPAGPQPC